MAETNPQAVVAGLSQLNGSRANAQSVNPYSTAGTTSDSQYLQGLTYDRNPEYIKAVNQGFWDSMGNSVAQTLVGIPLEIGEGIGYLGVGNIIDKINGAEKEFGNSFSSKLREWNEQFKQAGAPIYTTPDNEGFKPWDYKWWAQNMPSMASAVSLLIPAAGLVKGIGRFGKAIGGLNAAKKLGITTEALQAGEVIGMAATSRHMEGMMEGMEVYQRLFDEAKIQGKSEEEASRIAAQGGSDTYNQNWPLIVTDILQFGLAFKSFSSLGRIKSIEEAAKKTLLQTTGGKLLTQAGLEAGEEGYQYVVGKEAERKAAIENKLRKEDYSTYSDRLMDYVTEGDFWTSAFFGALGGAAFQAVGSKMEGDEKAKQKIVDGVQKSALEKSIAVFRNDPIQFKKSSDVDIQRLIIAGLENGRVDKVEEMLNQIKQSAQGEEGQEIITKADQGIADLKYLETIYTNIFKDPTKKKTSELIRFELANRAELRSDKRLAETLTNVQAQVLDIISSERGLNSSYISLLKAQTEYDILNNEFKDQSPAEKDVQSKRLASIQREINLHKDAIKTNEGISDKEIDDRLNINKSLLNTVSLNKVLYDLRIDQNNTDYDKLNSEKGQGEISDKLKEYKDKANKDEFNKVTAKISPNSSFAELSQLKEQAVQLGKLPEFTQAYNNKLNEFRANATKFISKAPAASLTQRYEGNNLLKEHETNDLLNIALKSGGIPEGAQLTPEGIGLLYQSNPIFASKVNDYFAKADGTTNKLTKDDLDKQSTGSNPENPNANNGDTQKEAIKKTNKYAWNLQGVQFENNEEGVPDTNKPAKSNIAEKINWQFLNDGKLPLNATLHYEFDNKDEWNNKTSKSLLSEEERKAIEWVNSLLANQQHSQDFLQDKRYRQVKELHKQGKLNRNTKDGGVYGEIERFEEIKTTNAYEALFELAYYIDNNSSNKTPQNRIVVGVLSAYNENNEYESAKAKNDLKILRERLFKEVKDNPNSGIQTLSQTTKVKKVIGGRFWNTNKYNKIHDVLKSGQKLTLAIGRVKKLGNNNQVVLDTNGSPLQDRVVYSNVEAGAVYVLLEAPSGDIIPYKLFTHKVKEFSGMNNVIAANILRIKDAKTNEEKKEVLNDISEYADIKNISYSNGVYTIVTGSTLALKTDKVTEEELPNFANELIVQVDVSKINKENYNQDISEKGFISTDLNPYTHFHSTKVAIEEPKLDKIVVDIKATGEPINSPADIAATVQVTPKKIKGINASPIDIKPNPKAKEVQEIGSYTPINEIELRLWFKKNLPQVEIAVVDNLIEINKNGGAKAWGVFRDNAIELYKGAPKGTEYHEAFHAVFNMFLNDAQREVILNEASSIYNISRTTPKFTGFTMAGVEFARDEEDPFLNGFTNEKGSTFKRVAPADSEISGDEEVLPEFFYKNGREITREEYVAESNKYQESVKYLDDVSKLRINEQAVKIEEALADDFAKYIQQQDAFEGKLGYNIKNFFKKLYQFLKSIFTNDIDIESLFFRINNEFYKNKPLAKSNSIRYKLTNTDPYTRQRNVQTLNYYFFEVLEEYRQQKDQDISDIDLIKSINPASTDAALLDIYSNVYAKLYATWEQLQEGASQEIVPTINELQDLLSNFLEVDENGSVTGRKDYYQLALRDLSRYGIKVKPGDLTEDSFDDISQEKLFEFDEESDAIEGWQVKSIELNGKDSLSFNIRKLLRRTIAYTKNSNGEFEVDYDKFGFKRFINFDEIYNYLERNLAGIYNVDVMITVLEDLKNNRPEIFGIVEKLESDPVLKAQFFSNMSKSYIPYYLVQQEIKRGNEGGEIVEEVKYNVYNANRKGTYQLLIDDWYTNLITPGRNSITDKEGKIQKSETSKLLKEFDAIINSIKKSRSVTLDENQALSDIIAKFGIDVPPTTLQNEFTERPVIDNNRFVYLKPFDNYSRITNDIKTLLLAIDGGINPYKGDVAETTTVLNVAKVVARNELSLHQDSIINVEGKQVYSYTLPTFLHKKIEEFKSQAGREQYLNNWWFKENQWLKDLADERVREQMEIVLLDGLKMDNSSKGTKFFDMTDIELDTTDINMYWNNGSNSYAYYRAPILSDSPEAPYIRFKKYSANEIVNGLYNLLLAEQERINRVNSSEINIKSWSENGKYYQFIPEFNEAGIDVNNIDETKQFITDWLERKYNQEEARLKEEGILTAAGNFNRSVSGAAARTQGFLKDYFINKVFANAMMIQLSSIDLAFYKNFDDFQKRNGQIFKFTRMIDTSATWNKDRVNPTYKTVYLKDEIVAAKELGEFVHKELLRKGYSESFAKATSALYSNVNQTDAQAYITVDRYKQIMIGLGQWNDKYESAYKLIKKGKAWDDSYGLFLQPIKPFYFGHELVGDLIVPVQNKNSEVVLLPNLVDKHPQLKKMLKYMESNNIDSVQFNSAVKSGEYGTASANNIEEAIVHTLDNKYWGIQQETPAHHVDEENLLGSQLKKLILGDIPDDARFFGDKMSKKELVDTYQKLLTQNIIDSYNAVAEEFGDIKKIQKLLLEQVIDRNLGEYFENALEIVKDQEGKDVFNIPLFHPIHAKRFENILNSIIRNNVTKQKINGGSFVLMSSFGLSDQLKVVTNEKTGAVEYMEVLLPAWTKKSFPRNPKGEVDIEYIEKEAPELLELFGYRIPTEHKYSMRKLKVVGFTPDLMGGIAILPAEVTKVAGEDFDIDKMYTMIPNFEVKNGKLQKVKYKLDVEEQSKEARDNAIIDIISEIWSHPSISDQIIIPGGFDTLKDLAKEYRQRYPYDTNNSPILPEQQMIYFNRNSNGSKLIGIAANHNTNHVISQYTDLSLVEAVEFDGNKATDLSRTKTLDGSKLISRNVSEFLAAFVDNAKDPVADDLNLNDFTFNTVALITRLGYSLETAMAFVNQPIVRELTKRYHREGSTRLAYETAQIELSKVLNKIGVVAEEGIHLLNTAELINNVKPFAVEDYPKEIAEYQARVLNTFVAYKELADGLSQVMRASRSDVLGTGKTVAANNFFLQSVDAALASKTINNVNQLFETDAFPLVKVSTEYGVRKPVNELLSKYFPYGNSGYKDLYDKLSVVKGDVLTEQEINYVNNLSLNYIVSGFKFFKESERDAFINKFPNYYLDNKDKDFLNKFELVRYLKYIPKTPANPIPRIEFSSGTSVGNEQRELITRSWEAMLNSDNAEVSKFARNLVKYTYFTSGLTFTPNGFGHLIPTNYIDKLVDDQGVNFRDYLYKLLDESSATNVFDPFIEQLYRHETNTRLLQRVTDKDVLNKIHKNRLNTSLLISSDKGLPNYIKMYNNGREYAYSFIGVNATGDRIYNILEPLGYKNLIYEFNRYDTKDSVIAYNKLPKLGDDAFYTPVKKDDTRELYQDPNDEEIIKLEIELGLRYPVNREYKDIGSYDSDGTGYGKANRKRKEIEKKLIGTPYTTKLIKTPHRYGGGQYWNIKIVLKEKYKLTSEDKQADDSLNDILKQYLSKLGIKVEYINDLFLRLNNDAIAVADLTNKLIKIAKYGEDVNTLPEETGHFVEAYNRGTDWHSRLMELIVDTDVYKRVLNEYKGIYSNADDYKREAIGKLIGESLIKKYQENKPLGVTDSILRIVRRLWDNFIRLFKNSNEVTLNIEVSNILNKVAESVLNYSAVENSDIQLSGELYQLPNVSKEQEILQSGIESINKKILIYKDKALTEFTEKETFILEKLKDDLSRELYKKGLFDYTVNASIELKKIANRLNKINRTPESLDDKRNTISTLRTINDYVNGFKNTLQAINQENIFNKLDKTEKKAASYVATTAALAEELSRQYYKIGEPILVDILRQSSTNPQFETKVKDSLKLLEKDISYTQRWLDALSETSDSVLSVVDVMTKEAYQRARLKSIDPVKDLVTLQKKLEKAGIPSTNFMYERDFSGKLSGGIVEEYNYAEYTKRRKQFFLDNPKPKKENYKDEKDFVIATRTWRIAVATWFSDNTQPHPSREHIIKEKREEFNKLYANNTRLATQKFNEWLAANTITTSNIDPETGDFVTKYIKELSIPAEKYRSEQYQYIQSTPAAKEYYDYIVELRRQLDNKVPAIYKLGRLAPQVRKDFFERLFIQDKDGKKRLKGIVGVAKETKTTLAEQLIRNESDTDFGLTNENNEPIDMVPIFFTRKLEDSSNMSLDMTSSMVAMLYSVNKFTELNRIVDTLEFTKDVLGERKILTGKFDPVSLYNREKEKGKPIAKEGTDSLAYDRLVDFMNMAIYNKQRKDEGAFGQIDKAKLADFINSYVALNSLALNIYSGISNITLGTAMTRMEAIAGEFINNKDLLEADKIYALEIPKYLSEIGQRLDDSKLTLWVEHMDVLQNYDRDFRNIDAGRNTVFSRLMKTSSLYFINHAGEHFIQSRLSLALANNTKVKDLAGNELTLWDAFDVVGSRLVMKPNLKKVGSKKTGLFKENEDGQDLTQKDIIRFINRQNFINKRLHGIYNDVDKSAIQQYALGRIVLMFRKFIKPGWNRRFAKLTYNEEGEIYTEGYYATLGRFISNTFKELKEGNLSLGKNWNNLETYEKRNFLRLATEWAYVLASITAATVLTNLADDDEDNYALNLAAYEAYRMYSELRFFTSFTELWRIVKSPAPAVYQLERLARFTDVFNWNKEVERGKFKGLNRFEVGLLQLTPFAGTYINARTPEEQLRFYTNNGVTIF